MPSWTAARVAVTAPHESWPRTTTSGLPGTSTPYSMLDVRTICGGVRQDLIVKIMDARADVVRVVLHTERWLGVPLRLPVARFVRALSSHLRVIRVPSTPGRGQEAGA
ncbi:hypothetical protein [Kitasatospora sp. NPDC090091]|uniref:hypothetical protein n=1 Tax=Kitasatospora sp. NPDC090091 TaxID=3364081 RepID=UPI00382D1D3E